LINSIADIAKGLQRITLAGLLGWSDVKQRYRRSRIGPFWLTISMGVMIASIGFVFGQIFRAPAAEFLPFLAAGLILWAFISGVLQEGCTSFISAEAIIRQLQIPLFVHVLRTLWRNIIMFAHNIVILPIVFLVMGKPITWNILLCIPGLFLLVLNLTWMALLLGIFSARFRDFPQIVASVLQVVFYLTPIVWMPSLLPARSANLILDPNPAFHLMEVVRAPLLGSVPSLLSWAVVIAMAIAGWILTLWFYGRFRTRIAYWL